MKRLFGFLLVFVVFFSFSLGSSYAQSPTEAQINAAAQGNTAASGEFTPIQQSIETANGTPPSKSGNTTANGQKEPPGECAFSTSFSIVACIGDFVQFFIKGTLIQIAGFLLWITSNMFSYSVQIGILDFKTWASDALYPLWSLVRQIVSLGVVFIGLYLGFRYILGQDEKFARYLPFVVVFALFINFSYPLARFAVDVSNIISLNVYTAAFSNEALNNESKASAGAVIMNRLGLGSLALGATQVEGVEAAGGDIIEGINSVPAALLVVVFILYAAYVFFMATALMVMRTASLVFLIVASPFLLVDSVLPVLGDKAQQLRKIFFEQLAVGPVFMLMIALTTKFLTVFSTGPLKAGLSSGAEKNAVVVFFNVLMMIVMLHLALKVSKSISGSLGEYATSAIGKVGGVALGAATGGTGLLARNSLGRLAMKARDSKWVTNNQNTAMGRRLYDMSNTLANSSYDLRNSSVVAGGMQKAGLNMGKGRTAGYEQAMEDRRKDILARGARIKTRYERDVVDDAGNIIHRKGDVDEESTKALDSYVADGGGSVFMSKEQRQLAKEALGKEVDKKSGELLATVKKNADRDLSLYDNEKDDAEKERFLLELNRDLEKLKQIDTKLEGEQAQSILATIRGIEERKTSKQKAFSDQVARLTEKYYSVQGDSTEKVRAQNKLLLGIEDAKIRDAVLAAVKPNTATQRSGAVDFELPENASKVEDKDWSTYDTPPALRGSGTANVDPSVVSANQKARYEAAVKVAQEQMDNNAKGGGVDPSQASTSVPSNGKGGGGGASATPPVPVNGGGATATHNPTTDDAAAQVTALLARIKTNEETSRQQAATVIANAQASSKVSLQNNQTPPSSS